MDEYLEQQPEDAGPTELEPLDTEGPDLDDVLAEFNARIADSREHFREWRTEAKNLYDLVGGHQWDATDAEQMDDQGRPMVTFNVAGKFLDSVAGLQVNNRQAIRYYPRTLGDVQINELLTGAVEWCRDQCDAEHEESDAFWDLIVTGMGWIEHALDEETDPEGIIIQTRRDPLTMYADPLARKRNLSDANWCARKLKMTTEEYAAKFGGEPPATAYDRSDADDDEDATITVRHEPQDYQSSEAGGRTRRTITVWDYQFSRLEPSVRVQLGQEQKIVSESEYQGVAQQLQQAGAQAQPMMAKTFYRAFICHNEVKKVTRLPYQEGFLYKAITGKRDRNHGTWYGLGRGLRDPQLWTNKFFSSILYQIATSAKGGLIAEESAFTDVTKAEAEWAQPNSITWVRDGALRDGAVMPKPASPYPQGMDRLMTFSVEALPAVTGINLEMLGLADRQQAGVVESQRKQSAMAIISWAFDAMRRYYRESGRMMAALIRDYMADGRLIRIVGEEGAQYVPLIRDKLAGQYDVIVDEAPTSPNMQERTWAILQLIIPMALQAGIQVPPEVLDYAPLPADLAQKWKAMLNNPQKAQMEQMQQELMLRGAGAQVAKDETAAQLNAAKAQETLGTMPPDVNLIKAQTLKTLAEAGRTVEDGDREPDARRPN